MASMPPVKDSYSITDEEEAAVLEFLNQQFRNRFTELDPGFQKALTKDPEEPLIVEDWVGLTGRRNLHRAEYEARGRGGGKWRGKNRGGYEGRGRGGFEGGGRGRGWGRGRGRGWFDGKGRGRGRGDGRGRGRGSFDGVGRGRGNNQDGDVVEPGAEKPPMKGIVRPGEKRKRKNSRDRGSRDRERSADVDEGKRNKRSRSRSRGGSRSRSPSPRRRSSPADDRRPHSRSSSRDRTLDNPYDQRPRGKQWRGRGNKRGRFWHRKKGYEYKISYEDRDNPESWPSEIDPSANAAPPVPEESFGLGPGERGPSDEGYRTSGVNGANGARFGQGRATSSGTPPANNAGDDDDDSDAESVSKYDLMADERSDGELPSD